MQNRPGTVIVPRYIGHNSLPIFPARPLSVDGWENVTFKVHFGAPGPLRGRRAALKRVAWVVTLSLRMLTFAVLATAAPAPADEAIAPLAAQETIVLRGEVFHVQGVDVDRDFIYVSSVDTWRRRALLHKFTRAGDLVGVLDLTDGARYHAGGLSLDGDSVWVPVAEYRSGSTTRMFEVDKAGLSVKSSFMVADHIGAVAAAGGLLHGGNWDSAEFYSWTRAGQALRRVHNPARVAYQDLKVVDGRLVAAGLLRGGQAGTVDWLDPQTLEQRDRLAVGRRDGGGVWTQ